MAERDINYIGYKYTFYTQAFLHTHTCRDPLLWPPGSWPCIWPTWPSEYGYQMCPVEESTKTNPDRHDSNPTLSHGQCKRNLCMCAWWMTYHNRLAEILIHCCSPQGREVYTMEGGLVPEAQRRKSRFIFKLVSLITIRILKITTS